jgi:hypothetical protein
VPPPPGYDTRANIVIGPWGPLDPAVPALFAARGTSAGEAELRVVGRGLPVSVVSVTPGFRAGSWEKEAPTGVFVRREQSGAGPSLAPFDIVVKVGERTFSASGSVLSAKWTVRFWPWTKDPREDAAAWKALVAGAPADTLTLDGLDLFWGGAAPSTKVPADRFATVAETTLDLPAGSYRIRTTSDDGIRVLVDGQVVIEDWTHHAPKEDVKTVALAAGPHTVRVEHFEIDGWAVLRLDVEPATDHR